MILCLANWHRLPRIGTGILAVLLAQGSPAAAQIAGAPSAAALAPPGEYEDPEVRLQRVGYALARANADRCAAPDMLTGLLLHDRVSYAPADRERAGDTYDLTYGFGVLGLVPGSAASRAGMHEGDEIVALNGIDLAGFAADVGAKGADYGRLERFSALLDDELRKGPVQLQIRRGAARLVLPLAAERGCGGRFAMLQRSSLNAWADGRYVAVTAPMMDFAPDDQELAFVVAHEMAHNILDHARRLKGVVPILAGFGIGAGRIKRSEIEADNLAVSLLARAGMDLSAPERLLRRIGKARWMNLPITHPGTARRIRIVNEAIALVDSGTLPPVAGQRYAIAVPVGLVP